MTIFYFIRHGETEWNVTGRWQGYVDVPLNDIGYAQAQRLANRLRNEKIQVDKLYSSDLQRAWDTALAVGETLGIEPQPLLALREIDLGTWGGLTRAEIAARDPETLARIDAGEDVPRGGAESMADLYERVVSAVEQLARIYPDQTIVIATHGGPVRMLLRHALKNGATQISDYHSIGNTSITIMTRTTAGWQINVVNDMAHLEGSAQAPDLMSAPPDDAQQA